MLMAWKLDEFEIGSTTADTTYYGCADSHTRRVVEEGCRCYAQKRAGMRCMGGSKRTHLCGTLVALDKAGKMYVPYKFVMEALEMESRHDL